MKSSAPPDPPTGIQDLAPYVTSLLSVTAVELSLFGAIFLVYVVQEKHVLTGAPVLAGSAVFLAALLLAGGALLRLHHPSWGTQAQRRGMYKFALLMVALANVAAIGYFLVLWVGLLMLRS